ncbi:hypothetical protein [Thermobifida fusca]|uniref:hypothetical protein n=1 Tax=Thermobifida fusca TaxID=2021 RepID=UPI000D19F2AC|nr:hypothetical protein [Thermobifida fusca]QOS60625.1 hypothetical protein IM867_12685 [Thermobifida fusca]
MSTTGEAPSSGEVNIAHVVMIAAAAAMGGFLFGYDSAVIVLLARRPRASALGRKRHPPIADRS